MTPADITTVLVHRREVEREPLEQETSEVQVKWIKESFLAPAYAQDLENEQLSLKEAQANSKRIREAGEAVDNQSMLDEMHDCEAFLDQKKKSRRDRQKEAQAAIQPAPKPTKPTKSDETQILPEAVGSEAIVEIPQFETWDFDKH